MDGLGGADSARSPQSNEQPHAGGGQPQRRRMQGNSLSAGRTGNNPNKPIDGISTNLASAGQHTDKTEMEAVGDWSGNRGGGSAAVLGAALVIENLLVDNQPKEEQPKQIVERKNRQKKKQEHDHGFDRGMEMR